MERTLSTTVRIPEYATEMEDLVEKIYHDGTYAEKHPEWHEDDSDWKASHLNSLIIGRVMQGWKSAQDLRVAEVGCGFGGVMAGVCAHLEKQGVSCSMTGYDIAEYALDNAARRYPDMKLVLGDFMARDETYDLGLMIDFFEHVEDAHRFLRAASEQFRWTLFHIPLDENYWGKSLRRGYYYDWLKEDRGHVNYYSKSSAMALLRETGHRIVRWKFTPWGLEREQGGGRSAPFVKAMRWFGMHTWPSLGVRVMGGASLACLCESVRD